jgi:hypothetical protein
MKKYLYLTKKEWARAWIHGGIVPLNPASFYKSDRRGGTSTPDENIERSLRGISERDFEGIGKIHPGAKVNIQIGEVVIDGETRGADVLFKQEHWDGVILSTCNVYDKCIADRLEKKACVEIQNIEKLQKEIDDQLRVTSRAEECEYTKSSDRGPFLKSVEDSWQEEYRILWNIDGLVEVVVSAGTAIAI